jgi:periplasmic divalent cation tolerance protein
VDFFQVLTTLESKEDAAGLAQVILDSRAAACVQIVGPIESHYWWQGAVQTEAEYLCLIKTHSDALDRLMQLIRDNHPYDVPEITATPIVTGSQAYLDWIAAEVRTG